METSEEVGHDRAMPADGDVTRVDELTMGLFSGRADRRVGRFAGRPEADLWVWDRSLFDILGYQSGHATASLELLLRHVADEDHRLVADAFREAVDEARSFAVSCQLRTSDDRHLSILLTAELMEAEPSGSEMAAVVAVDGLTAASGPWLVGHVIDLTELRLTAAAHAADYAVAQSIEHRAAIEQAKGMLMLAHRIDADAAFAVLRRHSQNTNTKLHVLAARIITQVAEPATGERKQSVQDLLNGLLESTSEEHGIPPTRSTS